jgi:hypothetical protein
MKILRLLAALVLLSCALLQAQLAPTAISIQTWTNPDLGLILRYPALFNKEPVSRLGSYERAVFALHPEADPQHIGADPCAPVLLSLGSGLDRLPDPPQKGKPAPTYVPKGTLTVSEIKRSCLDKETLDDTVLAGLVGANASGEGMRVLTRTTNDFIQGSTVWSASAAGYARDEKGRRSPYAGTLIVGTVGAVVNGHMLVWSVTSNDPELFNRLINLSVCFSKDPNSFAYDRLVHFQIAKQANPQTASR